MEIRVERTMSLAAFDLSKFDPSFEISAVVAKPYPQALADDPITTRPISHRTKRYPDNSDADAARDTSAQLVVVALNTDSDVCGYLRASKAWNGLVSLDDIAIHRPCRRLGVARKLIEELKTWARDIKLPAIRAETQDTNVPACAFYRANGFEFGGYDEYLYAGIEESKGETALYWYWFADGSSALPRTSN